MMSDALTILAAIVMVVVMAALILAVLFGAAVASVVVWAVSFIARGWDVIRNRTQGR
jgi:hypothetical protein